MSKVNLPGVAWVGLILLLIPVIQQWVAVQWPESAYPISALFVGVLAALAKWLELAQEKRAAPPPGVSASDAPGAPVSKVRRFWVG